MIKIVSKLRATLNSIEFQSEQLEKSEEKIDLLKAK
jgi:hypothetical protein